MESDIINISDEDEEPIGGIEPWVVICADDDHSAHRSTAFALEGELIEGRPVQLISAYSAAEAIKMVRDHPEAAALLLDVVMETPTAGLDAIEVIREKLNRKTLRIIVRSGAPGLMGELETVKRFDITDWRPKNELNQSRLLSAITLAVRANQELVKLDKRSAGLDTAMMFLERLAKDPSSELLMGDLLGSIESCLLQSIWVASTVDNSWRVTFGPQVQAQAGASPFGNGKWSGTESMDDVDSWLGSLPRHKRALESIEVAHEVLQASIWSPQPIDEDLAKSEQARALLRALSSALAGQEKSRQERLALLSDTTTGLLSRQGFIEKAPEHLDSGKQMAVYLIDLAGFARVNSALGHEAGDEILLQAGLRIKKLSKGLPCARIGSDTFAMLMEVRTYSAQSMEEAFEEPLPTSIIPIPMKPRVSAAMAVEKDTASFWLTRAAAAMEEAKSAAMSGGEPKWFDPKSESFALERMAVSQKLFLALRDKKGLFMVFQPQVDLISGRVSGCEALIRWKDGENFIPPDRFIPIAEQSGLAMAISEFALAESLSMMKKARDLGLDLPRVSVNLSPVEFESGDLGERVRRHLATSGCQPSDLMIEITETAAAKEPERMVGILKGLREQGIKVAIDDFGSGYSSLAQLTRLPIDELKIDRAFVNALGQQGPFSGIAKMIVDLANSMQLEVVAEGVEKPEQAMWLVRLGAHSAQGWMYAKGLEMNVFFEWLKQRRQKIENEQAN